MKLFLFDVDGTLTPSRGRINSEFAEQFLQLCSRETVCTVTGSDLVKTVEQLGNSIVRSLCRSYNCVGSVIYRGSDLELLLEPKPFALSEQLAEYLRTCVKLSEFPIRTGQHIEHRQGMINFSIVGRGADAEQRAQYAEWDRATGERHRLAEAINTLFPEVVAHVGGETGLDIVPQGVDKSQILQHLPGAYSLDQIVFFGDAVYPGGNDYPLAAQLPSQCVHSVRDWRETQRILTEYYGLRE
jgi:phosphomannomutase